MALRDQPYIPLYVDDYLTDEKLNMCSASTQGVYIKILCILHKQTEYGKLLLKQKEKQNLNICLNFAAKFAKILPFTIDVILPAIEELIEENVLYIDGDCIYQKRMIKDNSLSLIRSNSGKKGGKKSQEKNKDFAKAKNGANTVIEYVNEIENNITNSSNNTKCEISKKIALPFKFSEISQELKSNSQTKEHCVKFHKLIPDQYETYIDWFMSINSDHSPDEIVDFKEWNKHFKEWIKFNNGKLPEPTKIKSKLL